MTDAYRPGDIAMMSFRPGGGPEWRPAVRMRGYLPDRDTWHALDSGVWLSNAEVGPIIGNVADIAELRGILAEVDLAHLPVQLEEARAEVASLARWKEEAMPVIDGLQELGKALRIPLGERITGPAALEAVQQLQDGTQQLRDAAQAFLDAYDDVGIEVWWPEESESLREALERTGSDECPDCGHVSHGGWCEETVGSTEMGPAQCGCSSATLRHAARELIARRNADCPNYIHDYSAEIDTLEEALNR